MRDILPVKWKIQTMNFIAVQKSPRQRQHFEVQYLTGRYIAMFLRSFMASELTGTLLYDF